MLLQESYFYFTSRALICSILEYRSPVFIQLYQVMISYLSEDQERLQKRAMKILYPELSYAKALELSGLLTLYHRRETNAAKLFAYRFSSKRETARRISTGWELKALLFRSMGRCESLFDMTACQALVQSQFQKKKDSINQSMSLFASVVRALTVRKESKISDVKKKRTLWLEY